MRKKTFNPDKARHKAMQLFWQKGYDCTSMEDLLNQTGLSRSSFYNTFGNKRDLYVSILDDFSQLSLFAYQSLHSGKPMLEALNNFFEVIFFSPFMKLEHGCLLVNTILEQQSNDDELVQLASDALYKVEQELLLFFEHAIGSGQLSNKIPPPQLAAYFMTNIKGARVAAREGKSSAELKTNLQTAMFILEH